MKTCFTNKKKYQGSKNLINKPISREDNTSKVLSILSETNTYTYHKDDIDWFIGFVEGDGCFTHNRGAPVFAINLHEDDAPILNYIKKILGFGNISRCSENMVQYRVYKIAHIEILIHIFNGNLLLNKRKQQFIQWVTIFNNKQNKNIEAKTSFQVDTSVPNLQYLRSTRWLSGFIDAEGCFNLRDVSTSNGVAFQFRFHLGNKVGESKNRPQEYILRLICDALFLNNKKIYCIKNCFYYFLIEQKITKGKETNDFVQLIQYLTKYPLKSKKRLSFGYWLKAYNLFLSDRVNTTKKGKYKLYNCYTSLKLSNLRGKR